MENFPQNKCIFESFKKIINYIIDEFDDGNEIDIVLPCEEVSKFIVALISTGKFNPYYINYERPDISGYSYEYNISINHLNDNFIFVEPIYDDKNDKYKTFCTDTSDIIFVSAGISKDCFNKIIDDRYPTVLFDIKD